MSNARSSEHLLCVWRRWKKHVRVGFSVYPLVILFELNRYWTYFSTNSIYNHSYLSTVGLCFFFSFSLRSFIFINQYQAFWHSLPMKAGALNLLILYVLKSTESNYNQGHILKWKLWNEICVCIWFGIWSIHWNFVNTSSGQRNDFFRSFVFVCDDK